MFQSEPKKNRRDLCCMIENEPLLNPGFTLPDPSSGMDEAEKMTVQLDLDAGRAKCHASYFVAEILLKDDLC